MYLFMAWFFFVFHFLLLFLFVFMLDTGGIFLSFDFLSLGGMDFSVSFLFDEVSLLFGMVVLVISGSVMLYSNFYMGMNESVSFYYLVFLFVVSMLFLVFGGNFLFLMVGWDGLGIVSFILVVYYQNKVSVQSGLLTVLVNRLGDACFILVLSFIIMGSDNVEIVLELGMNGLFVFLLGLGGITKSAQYPFSSWLPAAMTAPTPVSSLVHSSTLVTAGIYLFLRFYNFMIFEKIGLILIILGLLTMLIGGSMAVSELDVKKIVAFSTLSQLGLMMFMLSLGEWEVMFFHLLSHAIFKSLLFLMCGWLMLISFGSQDGRFIWSFFMNYFLFRFILGVTCLNLIGFPLMMGFMSKDLIFDCFLDGVGGFLVVVLFFIGCGLTVIYSLKIYLGVLSGLNMGGSLISGFSFKGLFNFAVFLFNWISFMGLFLEELIVQVDFFSFSQDVKFLDFFIIFSSLFMWLILKYNSSLVLFDDFLFLKYFIYILTKKFNSFSEKLESSLEVWLESILVSSWKEMFSGSFSDFIFMVSMNRKILFYIILFVLLVF